MEQGTSGGPRDTSPNPAMIEEVVPPPVAEDASAACALSEPACAVIVSPPPAPTPSAEHASGTGVVYVLAMLHVAEEVVAGAELAAGAEVVAAGAMSMEPAADIEVPIADAELATPGNPPEPAAACSPTVDLEEGAERSRWSMEDLFGEAEAWA